jgi:hypothetical protein
LDQPDRSDHVAGFHSVNLNELYRPTHFSQSDNCLRAALRDVNVRWRVLTWREEYTDRKAIGPDNGWQWNLTQRLGFGNGSPAGIDTHRVRPVSEPHNSSEAFRLGSEKNGHQAPLIFAVVTARV